MATEDPVRPLIDPPFLSAAFTRWWLSELKPLLTWAAQLRWAQIDPTGADPADIGAAPAADLTAHIADMSDVHGATGRTVGTGDAATAGTRGAVFRGVAVADAATSSAASTATITTADADATYGTEERDLLNELKADHNTLVGQYNTLQGDVVALAAQLNALLASERAAGQIAT